MLNNTLSRNATTPKKENVQISSRESARKSPGATGRLTANLYTSGAGMGEHNERRARESSCEGDGEEGSYNVRVVSDEAIKDISVVRVRNLIRGFIDQPGPPT